MLKTLLATNGDWTVTILRLAAGFMIFPHGLQKTFGWFGGAGFAGQMNAFTQFAHIPVLFAFLAIMAELLGGIGLILGLLTRVAAFGVACNMVMAVYFLHWKVGFFMNWSGKQMGEGFEFHLLAVAILVVLMAKGGGAASVDRAIARA